ncbi:MAG: O-antigen ligase family protein [Verrucomicrobia bacterium]|nr:O-antigen ligase family protein [Verrucomicrobiota bacterium]
MMLVYAIILGFVVFIAVVAAAWKRPLLTFALFEVFLVTIGLFGRVIAPIPFVNLLKDLILVAYLIGAGVGAYVRGRRLSNLTLLILASLCCVAAIAASLFTHEWLRALSSLRFYIVYPMLIFAGMLVWDSRNHIYVRRFFIFNMLLFMSVSAFGIVDYMMGNSLSEAITADADRDILSRAVARSGITENAVVSTLGNRPNMGSFACLGVILALAMRGKISGKMRWLPWASVMVCLAALLFTFSRTAYVAVAIGVAVLVWSTRQKILHFVVVLAIGAVVGITAAEVSGRSLISAFDTMDSTLSGRVGIWSAIMDQFMADPFGSGLGVFGNDLNVVYDVARQNQGAGAVDSSYLLVLFEQGAQGFTVFIAFVSYTCFFLFRASRQITSFDRDLLLSVALAWAAAMAAMAFSTDMFHIVYTVVPFYWLLGAAMESANWSFGRKA